MNDDITPILEKTMTRLAGKTNDEETAYLAEDGLLHCKICHSPIQCRVRLWERESIVTCMCKCQEAAYQEEQKRLAQEEEKMKIQRLKANGIQDRQLLACRFEIAEENQDIRIARRYVENWKKVKAENLGLLLWGDVGTGKSFMAACIANALLEQGVPVLMTNFSKILNQMGAMYSEERYRYIASFTNYSLLIIDDLGIERGTDYALEQVYAVIDERYKTGLPVIITTNIGIEELRNPVDVQHERIYSRVLEMCTPVRVRGNDRRMQIGKSKQEVMKEVLRL